MDHLVSKLVIRSVGFLVGQLVKESLNCQLFDQLFSCKDSQIQLINLSSFFQFMNDYFQSNSYSVTNFVK